MQLGDLYFLDQYGSEIDPAKKKKKNGHWMIFEMVDERKATINRTGY